MRTRLLLGLAFVSSLAACSDQVEIATTTVGTTKFFVSYEDAEPAAGSKTNFVIKPGFGADHPASVTGWVGSGEIDDSMKTPAVFDDGDGDYDCPITLPDPLPDGTRFFFDVVATDGAAPLTGSVDVLARGN